MTFSPTRLAVVEGVVLVVSAPLLLFPEQWELGTAFVLLLLAVIWLIRLPAFPVTPYNLALLVWGMAITVGILATADPQLTLPKATGLILGLAVWRYLAMYCTVPGLLSISLGIFLLTGLGFVGFGVLAADWYAKFSVWEQWLVWFPPTPLSLMGASETGVQLNQLAGTLIILLPLSLSLSLTPPVTNWSLSYIAVPLTILLVILLILSQSRSGWGAAIAGIVTLFILRRCSQTRPPTPKNVRKLWIIIGTSLFLLSIFAIGYQQIAPNQALPKANTPLNNLDSWDFRQEVWQWAVAGIRQFPLTGTGLGTFRAVAPRLYPLNTGNISDIAHAHNIFLQVALDAGIPGLIAYLSILFIALITRYPAFIGTAYRPWSDGLLAGIIALHTFGLTDALAPGSKPALLYWFALGLLTALTLSLSKSEALATNATPQQSPRLTNLSPARPPTAAKADRYSPHLSAAQPNSPNGQIG